MAIATDDAVWKHDATPDDLASSSASVTDTFSVAGDEIDWVVNDDVTHGLFILECTFATAPAANAICNLFLRADAVDGTNDEPDPSDTFRQGYVGRFLLKEQTAIQRIMLKGGPVALPIYKTSSTFRPFVEVVGSGQAMSAGWKVIATQMAIGPK